MISKMMVDGYRRIAPKTAEQLALHGNYVLVCPDGAFPSRDGLWYIPDGIHGFDDFCVSMAQYGALRGISDQLAFYVQDSFPSLKK